MLEGIYLFWSCMLTYGVILNFRFVCFDGGTLLSGSIMDIFNRGGALFTRGSAILRIFTVLV